MCESSKCDITNPLMRRSELENAIDILNKIKNFCFICPKIAKCEKVEGKIQQVIDLLEVLL